VTSDTGLGGVTADTYFCPVVSQSPLLCRFVGYLILLLSFPSIFGDKFVARNARIPPPIHIAENNTIEKCNEKGIYGIKSTAEAL
jgi:hypothetical protein